MTPSGHEDSPFTVGFLLFPNFAMLSFSSVIEPLRIANRLSGRRLYRWELVSLDDEVVEASNGIPFTPTLRLDDWRSLDAVILVAGTGTNLIASARLFKWLREVGRSRRLLGSTSTGSILLARAGVLRHKRCTIHWEDQASLQEEHPDLLVTNELFEIEENILTCSGGTAGLDMMLSLIDRQQGSVLAKHIADQCIHPDIRPAHDKQRMSLEERLGVHNPALSSAIHVMHSHIEDTINCEQIADLVGISHRQLQRLFKEHFGVTPASYYLNMRLEHGDSLLRKTSLDIINIATATGFSSTSHFSKCYRKAYGISPRERRKVRA
ncbi:GlxA family transcriptional regulator [Halomonas beimenensis]|uniref:Transcriptional regulator containing an amidase domain and an AraC-type DNA-binding HTH domain n=1 Tax=Halomonas beimenensis TaxID=475662 RepID=A0A291P4V9_9GAMM|nr:GlxA family transcriptional regulator [Halomonas beimenensis]ATJ81920.1 transcriptional regulator containing an amidase domain and an AraC-type DNA-binding HTH domain [Halomonas beimenensis]